MSEGEVPFSGSLPHPPTARSEGMSIAILFFLAIKDHSSLP